jgi:hypothetical protein
LPSIASNRTKHIKVRHRTVQDLVESKEVEVKWIPTEDQAADILTKSLPRPVFMKFKEPLQVQDQVKADDISKVEKYIVVVGECLNVIP